jgi:hypothetical protein
MPEGYVIPSESELLPEVKKLIAACRTKQLFAEPPVTELTTECAWKKDDKKEQKEAAVPTE